MSKKSQVWGDLIKNASSTIQVTVLPELKELIPSLTQEELEGLETSIVQEGCREPLLLWENPGTKENILVDGHNRFQICNKHSITFKTTFKDFLDLDAVKDWMISNQLGRRNLSEYQKSYLRGLQYNREKKALGGDRMKEKAGGQNDSLKTRDKLAEEHKVSPKTIQRDEKFALGLDKLTEGNKELKDKILNKEIKIPQSIIQEASVWEEEKLKDVQKKIETGQLSELLDELKNTDKKIEEYKIDREKIVAKIMEYLKTASDKDLEKIMKAVKI